MSLMWGVMGRVLDVLNVRRKREIYFCIESQCTKKIQNNLTKHKINKYNDFLMRGNEKTMSPAQ